MSFAIAQYPNSKIKRSFPAGKLLFVCVYTFTVFPALMHTVLPFTSAHTSMQVGLWKTVPTVMEQVKLLFAMIVENVLTLIRITVMNVQKSKKKRK